MVSTFIMKIWGTLKSPWARSKGPGTPPGLTWYEPLPVALRFDISLPAGREQEIQATRFYWVAAAKSDHSTKALRITHLSN